MKFKLLSLASLATSFVFISSAYAAGPISRPDVFSRISLKEGATPLSCVTVAMSTPTTSFPAYYVAPVFTLTNNCTHGEATAGIVFQLDLSNSDKQALFSTSAAPVQLSSISPWAPYPATFVPNLNTYITNDGFTIQVALAFPLTTGQQIDLGYNLAGITADQLAGLYVTSLASAKIYSIKNVVSNLTVNDGGEPVGFSTAAYPQQYPVIQLQYCPGYDPIAQTCPMWYSLGAGVHFTAWEQNKTYSGILAGQYQLLGNTLNIGNGAVFAPALPPEKTAFPLSLLPFPSSARIAYKQTANATGSVNIQMPARPAGQQVPATVVGYLRDHASGALLQSVPGLSWGTTTNVENLAPAETFDLTFSPILLLSSHTGSGDCTGSGGDQLCIETLTGGTFTPTTESPAVEVTGSAAETPSWSASFKFDWPTGQGHLPPQPSPAPDTTVSFTDVVGDLPLSLVEPLPIDSQAHTLIIPGMSSSPATFSTPTIEYTDPTVTPPSPGYIIPTTKAGTTAPTNEIQSHYFPVVTVPGWPTGHIDMGNLTGDGGVGPEGLTARQAAIDAIFKYSGSNGAGDRGQVWPAIWTELTIDEAHALSVSKGAPVIPVMVDYTAQMSGGTSYDDIDSQDTVAKHFTNLAMDGVTLHNAITADKIIGGSVLLNPDLIGMIAQNDLDNPDQLTPAIVNGHVDMTQAAATAYCVAQLNIGVQQPISQDLIDSQYAGCVSASKSTVPVFANTFAGWVEANNWLINHFGGPKVSYGWMMNIWSAENKQNVPGYNCTTASATWVHFAVPATVYPCYSKRNEFVLNEYNFYNQQPDATTNPRPSYIAFDKYEMDVVTGALGVGYLFNYRDMENYFSAIQQVSQYLVPGVATHEPVMLFQMPGGHIRSNNDVDSRPWPNPHISTMPDYIFGDPLLNKDFSGAQDLNDYLETVLADGTYNCQAAYGCTVRDYLTGIDPKTGQSQDWTQSNFDTMIQSSVFAILWGGGTSPTTSIASYPTDDGGWLFGKITGTLSQQ